MTKPGERDKAMADGLWHILNDDTAYWGDDDVRTPTAKTIARARAEGYAAAVEDAAEASELWGRACVDPNADAKNTYALNAQRRAAVAIAYKIRALKPGGGDE